MKTNKELNLLSCPHCGKPATLWAVDMSGGVYVFCDNCGMRGPVTEEMTEHAAIAAWNALSRRLKWTQEEPTVEGMYWCRCIDPCRRIAGPANIMYYTPGCTLIDMYDEFAGPLPEPEEK